jgi:heme/copper-type cytochrome/quinol oxidase subunit 3
MVLPYTVERRPDTGVNNVMLGMWLFLASEVMLFGGLFSAYVLLRSGAADWPAASTISSVTAGAVNTAILLLSSMTIAMARGKSSGKARRLLGATAALGALFLGIKAFEYATKLQGGLYPSSSTFLALYYLLTAVHAVHVLGGVVVNGYLAVAGARSTGGSSALFANRVTAAALYWHFVDIIWVAIFVVLYLL